MVVKVIECVNSYEEAIKISCDELVKRNSIEEIYYNAIINKIEEFGPYFCIAENVAMPHARPEDGVKESDMCLLKLNTPVDFLGKKVSVFFTISAKDSNSHLETMRKIAQVCMDENKLNKILNSKNENEIMEVM